MLEKDNKLSSSENKSSFLFALIELYKLKVSNIGEFYKISLGNRMNSQGEMLEFFIKDLFSGSYLVNNWKEKEKKWNDCFSKPGSPSRPPDFITHDGIMVEIKKIQSKKTQSNIHFNSSYPKKYYLDKERKIALNTVYIIGTLSKENDLKELWFVYGDCLFAENDFYKQHKKKIKEHIGSAKDKDEQGTTVELGRYNEIDPLKITDLRIRGMYQIKHPKEVFDYLWKDIQIENSGVSCFALVLESRWEKFTSNLKSEIEKFSTSKDFFVKTVLIKNPDDPEKQLSAKFIHFSY